jgi:hypothetical protein
VDNLKVGSKVSVDHFDIRLKGRTCDSYGKPSSTQYLEGALFVEDASGYIKCEHQVDFSAVETLRANQTLNGIADQGIFVQDYLTDNGAFKANTFVAHINESQQLLRFCGTNAYHQNGVAKRAIQLISNMARAMILHARMHWKDGIDASLWPIGVQYAFHVYNNTPKDGVSSADIFYGTTLPRMATRR